MPRVAGLALLVSMCACAPAYLHTASRFAQDGQAQLQSLAPAESLAGELCQTRARLDLVQHRLTDPAHGWGSTPTWSGWMDAERDPSGKTWRQKCDAERATDAVLHQSTRLLRAYLAKLRGVAEGELPLGVSPSLVAKGITAAVAQLHAGVVSQTAAALEGPLTDLATLMLAHYDAHQLRPFLRAGDPAFQKLVSALERYIDSVDAQRAEVAQREGALLDALEPSLARSSPDDPARTIVFLEFADGIDAKLRSNARAVLAYRDTLQRLSSAHAALTRAALK